MVETVSSRTNQEEKPPVKFIAIKVTPKVHTRLKTLAAKRETSIQDLCLTAVQSLLEAQ